MLARIVPIASKLAPTRWLGACCVVLWAFAMSPLDTLAQEPAAKAATVRPEIGKPLQAALDLLKQKKGKDALAKVREADAVSDKTAHEIYVLDQVRGQAAASAGEAGVAARSFEAAAVSASAPEKERLQFFAGAASQYYVAKDYAKAADLASRYFKEGGGDKALRTLQVQALYLASNFAQAAKELLADIQADEQAGKAPTEERLQMLASASQKQQNAAGYTAALEKLVTYHPKPDYWLAVIYGMRSRPGFPDRLSLDVGRLRLATGTLRSASEYVEAAQLSLQAGFPAEAKKFIDAGYTAGLLGAGPDAERHKRLKDLAAKNLAEDTKLLGQDDAQATSAKDGTVLLNNGLNYVLHGRSDKGLAMMESGLGKGGMKHPEDARLHLGYAYYLAGQTQKATQMFKKAQETEATAALSRLWAIRLGQASN